MDDNKFTIAMNDQLCSICLTSPSHFICFCREERLCAECLSSHLLSEPFLPHKPVAFASGELMHSSKVKGCHDSGETPEAMKRNIIEKELRRLQTFHNDALIQLQRVKVHYEAELARTIEDLSQSLSSEVSKMIAVLEACCDTQTPSPALDSAFVTRLSTLKESEDLIEMAMEVRQVDLASELRQSVTFSLDLKEVKSETHKLFKFFGGCNSIGVFDVEKETYEKQSISSQKFLHNSCWCTSPSGELIITGGSLTGHSRNSAISFSPVTSAIVDLEPMQIARRSHASLCTDEFCYVFGGVLDEEKISLCERYDIKKKVWTAMPQMKERRAYLGCCLYKGLIIVCGGGETSSFEVLDVSSLSFQLFAAPQVDLCDVASVIPAGDSILIFHGNFNGEVSRLSPSTSAIVRENKLCYGNSWSSCAPLLYRDTVYLLRSDSVFKYSLSTGESSYVLRMTKNARKRDYE